MTAPRPTPVTPPSSDQAGYTLLEVVIALTLLAILSVILSGSLSFGTRVWERSSRSVRASGDWVSTYQFLDRTLGHLVAMPPDTRPENRRPTLVGDQGQMTLLAGGLADVGLAGPQSIRIRLVADRLQAEMQSTATATAGIGTGTDRKFVLIEPVASLSFAYRGIRDGDRDTGWVTLWPASSDPPKLVRVRIKQAKSPEVSWVFRLSDIAH